MEFDSRVLDKVSLVRTKLWADETDVLGLTLNGIFWWKVRKYEKLISGRVRIKVSRVGAMLCVDETYFMRLTSDGNF